MRGEERLSYWIRDDTGNGVRGWGKGKGCERVWYQTHEECYLCESIMNTVPGVHIS